MPTSVSIIGSAPILMQNRRIRWALVNLLARVCGGTLWRGAIMPNPDGTHAGVRPRTAVLTAGFDPPLSFGPARPAVFRSSTYVFASPEQAEHAFSVLACFLQAEDGIRDYKVT